MLHKKNINWEVFRNLLVEIITFNTPLKSIEDLENAVQKFCVDIQHVSWAAPATTEKSRDGNKTKIPFNVR